MMGARIADVEAAPEPELVRLMSRIQDATARLGRLHEVGQLTANRVFGSMPEGVSANGKGPMSDGLISILHAVVDDLHSRITDCDADMQRLGAL
jgi:hypothetical protein